MSSATRFEDTEFSPGVRRMQAVVGQEAAFERGILFSLRTRSGSLEPDSDHEFVEIIDDPPIQTVKLRSALLL